MGLQRRRGHDGDPGVERGLGEDRLEVNGQEVEGPHEAAIGDEDHSESGGRCSVRNDGTREGGLLRDGPFPGGEGEETQEAEDQGHDDAEIAPSVDGPRPGQREEHCDDRGDEDAVTGEIDALELGGEGLRAVVFEFQADEEDDEGS